MKTIMLQQAVQILQECAALIVDGVVLTCTSTSELTEEDDNEFLYLSWDDEGLQYEATFIEENNRTVRVEGSTMYLEDNEGNETKLTVLEPSNLEEKG